MHCLLTDDEEMLRSATAFGLLIVVPSADAPTIDNRLTRTVFQWTDPAVPTRNCMKWLLTATDLKERFDVLVIHAKLPLRESRSI